MISFDDLSPVEFEEFTYELLVQLDFRNVNWRKGTGLESSPPDQGRDIEASRTLTDVDGNPHTERWFVECKHHKKGVPASELSASLSAATALRPDVLLFVASGFLSNPAKDHLDHYIAENKPPFRIKQWELKNLEQLTLALPQLRQRFGLGPAVPFLEYAHPNHLIYALKPRINSLNYFFKCMDALDNKLRDEAFYFEYQAVIKSRYRAPRNSMETLRDLMIDEVSYDRFKEKCLANPDLRGDTSDVHKMVTNALAWALHFSDGSNLPRVKLVHEEMIEYFQYLKTREPDDPDKQESLDRSIEWVTEFLQNADQNFRSNCSEYNDLCDTLIAELLREPPLRLPTARSSAHPLVEDYESNTPGDF